MPTTIEQARHFWICAGDMSGGSRNQIELTDDLALFFTDAERVAEIVLIRLSGGNTLSRPLTYRGDDYGQWTEDIWRLGLPTSNMGAPDYPGRVIKLQRSDLDGEVVYDICVADIGGEEAQLWIEASENNGFCGSTGDTGIHEGRSFGYWFD